MNEAELDRKSYLKQFKYNHEADAIAVDDKFQAANDVYIVSDLLCVLIQVSSWLIDQSHCYRQVSASDYRQVQVSASDCRQGKVSVLKTNNSVICAIQLVSSSKKLSGNWLVKTWLALLDRSLSSPIQGQISALIYRLLMIISFI